VTETGKEQPAGLRAMAEAAPELIQPCLLDRLTDDEPSRKQESRRERVISYKKYREGVLRDLDWLLNTEGFLLPEGLDYLRGGDQQASRLQCDLRDYPEAFNSVLNFGLKQFWGRSERDKEFLEEAFCAAIHKFEPRLMPGTLKVELLNPGEQQGSRQNNERLDNNRVTLLITAELWANPLPEQLNLKTTVDLEDGQCLLGDAPHG
jgi:type VI secretion system protein ImpF